MAEGLHSIHYNIADQGDDDLRASGIRPLVLRGGGRPRGAEAAPTFNNDESAARFHLSQLLERDTRPTLRGLTAPESPAVMPDLSLRDRQDSPLTNTLTVRFVQTKDSIPVFGSRAVVEMDRNRELLAVDATLAKVEGVPHMAALSPAEALARIASLTKVPVPAFQDVKPPELNFYHDDEKNHWHLAYYYRNVPAAPEDFIKGTKSHGIGRSLAQSHPELDYLVDAHDGTILLYWSSTPTAIAVPTSCCGIDEDGVAQKFYGQKNGSDFEMNDPWRKIRTYDFGGNDVDHATPPQNPVSATSKNFTGPAAVSAHVHATRVHDFYKSILMRDGVDDKGMDLISYVNCTQPAKETPPEWLNAQWWKQAMWYGQAKDAGGKLHSLARHLDVIGHELTHGVTEFTAELAYLRQSGALNESFSDIFGIIIKNWDLTNPGTGGVVAKWSWEIGPGLGDAGLPLRDMRDPTRTGDPDHMSKYVTTTPDNGGVHTNSNIHNKAAYNVLTATDAQGQPVFTPRDVAVLYYLCLARLGRLATFQQAKDTLLNVAGTYYAGDAMRQAKLDAIGDAYKKVGIL